MGSMGLSSIKEYTSIQVCAGGKDENEIQLSVSSTIEKSSNAVLFMITFFCTGRQPNYIILLENSMCTVNSI